MLGIRALSALVLAPPALAAAWVGGYPFAALSALAAAIMCWEWHGMVSRKFDWSGRVAAAGCGVACLLAVGLPAVALALVIGAALLSAALAPAGAGRLWAGAGALYAGLPAVALVWLRSGTVPGEGDLGRGVMFWLLLAVWATDIGAYACGRLIGGPLLAPTVSPKKTWSGLLGGMASAAAVGAGFAELTGLGGMAALAAGSAGLAVVAQGGDLLESAVKRRWGVKDASSIIPGHGGVLDRVDGLLAAGAAVALATLVTGRQVLMWSW